MGTKATTQGTLTTPDGDEAPQLDYWLNQLAEQIEDRYVGKTDTAGRSRIHRARNLGAGLTTDASGYITLNHGAPFTPTTITAHVTSNAATLLVPISTGDITATTVKVRFQSWSTGGNIAPAGTALNSSLTLVCYE